METTRTGGFRLRRRIGSTNYKVTAYFDKEATETLEDKMLRIIKNGACAEHVRRGIILTATDEPSSLKGVQENEQQADGQ